jgi:anti-sigma B factor antagonist
MDFAISSTDDGDSTLVTLVGELDVSTKPDLCEALDALRQAGRDRLVVDLGELVFMDSTGIGTLVGYAVEARERGGSLRVVNASGMPLRALQVTGVLELLSDDDGSGRPSA